VGTAEHWQKFHHRLCPIHCCIFVFAANDRKGFVTFTRSVKSRPVSPGSEGGSVVQNDARSYVIKPPRVAANATAHGVGMLFSIAPARRDPRTEQLRNLASPDWFAAATAQSFLRPEFARSRLEWVVSTIAPFRTTLCAPITRLQSPMFGLDPTERHNRTVLTARCRGRFGTRTRQQPRHHSVGTSHYQHALTKTRQLHVAPFCTS